MREIFENNGLNYGRMIGASKTFYVKKHSKNNILFNACVVTLSGGDVWHGDLDLTLDWEKLSAVSKEIGEPLYILMESDGYDVKMKNVGKAINDAMYIVDENGFDKGEKGKFFSIKIKKHE